MTLWHAIIFGIVEGITEFLPISSTGHLILTAKVLGLPQTPFLKSFEIAIQVGAILAVVVLFWSRFLAHWLVWKRIFAAFLPTALIGLIFYDAIKADLLGGYSAVLVMLFLGGVVLVVFELFHKENPNAKDDVLAISFKTCIFIGVFQSLAIFPGVSRSAATIIGGLALGLKRKTIVEFSFLLAVPTLLAATGLDFLQNGIVFNPDQIQLLLAGFVTSFVVAILGIKFFLYFIEHHNFVGFGIYRILISLAFWFFVR